MSLSYRLRPGVGFVVLTLVAAAAIAFLAWGLRLPPLERVWRMQLELTLGARAALSASEFRLFQDTLVRYPELADSLIEDSAGALISASTGGLVESGYAYAVRRDASAPGVLVVASPGGKKLAITARTQAAHETGEVRADAWMWRLPNDGPFPQLIEVRDTAGRKKARPMIVELRGTP